jgi:predicted nucleic acid-binding protein
VNVLIDTSVWIRFLSKREPWASKLDALLADESVIAHDYVHGELLIGNSGGRRDFLHIYERIQHAKTLPHAEVVAFAQIRGLMGRGIGWVDVHLLAATVLGGHRLWTADKALQACAQKLGVAYA